MSLLKTILGGFLVAAFISSPVNAKEVRHYVALGDSYTAGTGATPQESWPSVVTERLQKKGVTIELTANLGRSGWTTENLIEEELPVAAQLKPDLVSVLIGTNDWVHGISAPEFEQHLVYILDELLKTLKPSQVLVLTIPDFSVTPQGGEYSNGKDIASGLSEFNQIIVKHAQARGLKVVDLFSLSQQAGKDVSLVAHDGLHPSAKGYEKWADVIEPVIEEMLK